MKLVTAWMGDKLPEDDELVSYPESFDIRGLTDEFSVAQNLQLLQAPDSVRRYQMEILIDKIFPNLSKEKMQEIEKDLLQFPPKNEPLGVESKLALTYDKDTARETGQEKSQGTGKPSPKQPGNDE